MYKYYMYKTPGGGCYVQDQAFHLPRLQNPLLENGLLLCSEIHLLEYCNTSPSSRERKELPEIRWCQNDWIF